MLDEKINLQLFADDPNPENEESTENKGNKEGEGKEDKKENFTKEELETIVKERSEKLLEEYKQKIKEEKENEHLEKNKDYKTLWEKEKLEREKRVKEIEQLKLETKVKVQMKEKNIPEAFAKYLKIESENDVDSSITELFNLLEAYSNEKIDNASKMDVPFKTSGNKEKISIGKRLGSLNKSSEENQKFIDKYFEGGH